MRWEGRVARMGERTGANRVLVGKSEIREILARPGHRRKNNIKLDFQEVIWGMDWIDLAQDRYRWRALANEVINPRIP